MVAQQMQAAQQKAAAEAAAAQRQQMVTAGANAVALGGSAPSYYTNAMANEATLAGKERAAKLAKLQQEAAPVAPKAPEGYRPTATGGLEAIPGGPAAIKQQEKDAEIKAKEDADQAQKDLLKERALQGLATATRALSIQAPGANVGGPVTGAFPAATAAIGALSYFGEEAGAKVANLNSDYKTLKSAIGLAELQLLKSASKTGASGLGALNAKELESLQTALAELDVALPEKRQRENLIIIYNSLAKVAGEKPYAAPSAKERNAPRPQSVYNPAMSVPMSGGGEQIRDYDPKTGKW
jgi:hypothetical protein